MLLQKLEPRVAYSKHRIKQGGEKARRFATINFTPSRFHFVTKGKEKRTDERMERIPQRVRRNSWPKVNKS